MFWCLLHKHQMLHSICFPSEQSWPDEMQTNEQEKETELQHQVLVMSVLDK